MDTTTLFIVCTLALVLRRALPGCQEGHVCVYHRGGQLLPIVDPPGFHTMLPFITHHNEVQTTWQTDHLTDVECGSSKGGTVHLDIEVVNRLKGTRECVLTTVGNYTVNYDKPVIFDYIPSEVAQFCKNYTLEDIVVRKFDMLDDVLLHKLRDNVDSYGLSSCLEVKTVRILRPKLSPEMQQAFGAIEREQKLKDLAVQHKETAKVKLETQLQAEVMDMEREQRKREITLETQRMEAEAAAARRSIADDMEADTKRTEADAELYRLTLLAEGNKALYTEKYVKLEGFRAAHNNTKIIMGDIPQNALSLFVHNS